MSEPEAGPNSGYYLLNTDGGNSGDPLGRAAIGVLLRTRRLVTVAQISKVIGPATHNVAEYKALIEGLKLARDHGIQRLRVYMDSEIVVDQVNGDCAVREKRLRELHEAATDLVDLFKSDARGIRISWVPRELNAGADQLVRDALSGIDSGDHDLPVNGAVVEVPETALRQGKHRKASWRDLPAADMAAHLLATPTIADRVWTEEARLPRETRDAFVRRVLLGETTALSGP